MVPNTSILHPGTSVRHSPDPYAGQPASQEHQRLWPWRCVAPGSEAPPVEACQFRNVLKLRTGVLGWYFRRCLSVFFFKKNTHQQRPK